MISRRSPARSTVDGHDAVTLYQTGRGGRCREPVIGLLGHERNSVGGFRDTKGQHDPEKHQVRDEEVHADTGQHHHRLFPEFLLSIGAAEILGEDLLERVHANDADVTTQWEEFEAVFGLTTAERPEPGAETEEELAGSHPHRLGS
jgi:hypothetical protein